MRLTPKFATALRANLLGGQAELIAHPGGWKPVIGKTARKAPETAVYATHKSDLNSWNGGEIR
ncbi:MAG: hypothetical protein NUV72_05195, partial [Bauldia sp.]|nr:hypothetical protein [Bauldia sp.]